MTEMQALVPNYVDRFSCLGGDCRYTCCQQWSITFRKSDYKKLMKMRTTPEFTEKIRRMVRRLSEKASEKIYAQLDFNEDGFCPLLDEDKLCSLHRHCGAEALPQVCLEFPRIAFRILDIQEKHVRLECEAVFRNLLTLSEGVQYETRMVPLEAGKSYYLGERALDRDPLLIHYWTIKTLMLGILQSCDRPIAHRILFVGFVLQRLISLQENGQLDQVASVLEGLLQGDDIPIWASLEKLPRNEAICMTTLVSWCSYNNDRVYLKTYLDAVMRIGKINQKDLKDLKAEVNLEKYQAAKKDYVAFLERYPRALENIAVALFNEGAMPFGGVRDNFFQAERNNENEPIDLWLNYLYFCRQFSCLQFILSTTTTPDMEMEEFCKNAALTMRGALGMRSNAYDLAEQMKTDGFSTIDSLSVLLNG